MLVLLVVLVLQKLFVTGCPFLSFCCHNDKIKSLNHLLCLCFMPAEGKPTAVSVHMCSWLIQCGKIEERT